ncbi:hypothetical protein MNBD_ALPHA11-147 [hydrothermal vent metagenome]|uniref:Phosphoglycerate transport regulatory protein PgtC n=1 Tax=hydrothermal vent metagenome TaxID=652676 RepID=A0A3B0UJK6_9ZZZZ
MIFLTIIFSSLFLTPANANPTGELRILTSMPRTFFEPFAQAFEDLYPEVSVVVLNKNTNAAVAEIVRGNPRSFDVFWASSSEAFAVLNSQGAFLEYGDELKTRLPGQSNLAAFFPFALSSIGWTQNQASSLPRPYQWEDLLNPIYAEKIGMAAPSRSGSTHMFVERFLQVRGWEEGWAYLLELSGNLSTITSRSFGVIDGVIKQRFDIGITLDFLAQSRRENGLLFSYGRPLMVMPAQIGLLNGGNSSETAARFVEMVLSNQGQNLLLIPQISRVPIIEELRDASPEISGKINNALQLSWQPYNALLARDRYWSVNAIFDEFITFQLPKRKSLWQRVRELEAKNGAEYALQIAEIKRLLVQMPINEAAAQDPMLNDDLTRITALAAPTDFQRVILTEWTKQASELLEQADEILSLLENGSNNGQ